MWCVPAEVGSTMELCVGNQFLEEIMGEYL